MDDDKPLNPEQIAVMAGEAAAKTEEAAVRAEGVAVKTESIVTKTESVVDKAARNIRLVYFVIFVVLVLLAAGAMLIQRNNENIEAVADSNRELKVAIEDINVSVDHLEAFVTEVEAAEADPNNQAQDDAISRAVAMVPEIKAILCEQFPDATACVGG
jgi:hypothetical protein